MDIVMATDVRSLGSKHNWWYYRVCMCVVNRKGCMQFLGLETAFHQVNTHTPSHPHQKWRTLTGVAACRWLLYRLPLSTASSSSSDTSRNHGDRSSPRLTPPSPDRQRVCCAITLSPASLPATSSVRVFPWQRVCYRPLTPRLRVCWV